jgi:hypothetical protein
VPSPAPALLFDARDKMGTPTTTPSSISSIIGPGSSLRETQPLPPRLAGTLKSDSVYTSDAGTPSLNPTAMPTEDPPYNVYSSSEIRTPSSSPTSIPTEDPPYNIYSGGEVVTPSVSPTSSMPTDDVPYAVPMPPMVSSLSLRMSKLK